MQNEPLHQPLNYFSTDELAQLDRRTWRCIAASLFVGTACSVLMIVLAF